ISMPLEVEATEEIPANILPDWFMTSESDSEIIAEVTQEQTDSVIKEEEIPDTLPDWFLVQEDELLIEAQEIEEVQQTNNTEKVHFDIPDIQISQITSHVNSPRQYQSTTVSSIKVEVPSIQQSIQEPVFHNFSAKASEGLQKIASSLDSMDFITKSIAQHMAACNGVDGHKGRAITAQAMDAARETALFNVMNTKIGRKISENTEITEEDQKIIEDIVSMTYQSQLGVDTSTIRQSGVSLSDFSQVQQLMPQIIPPHQHGAGCSHGGSGISGGSSVFAGGTHFLENGSIFDKHDHSEPNVFCKCGKTAHVHFEGKKLPKCSCGETMQ
ncbi:MAG TPA: hypothetical protein PLS49_05115, partial [Candidatus Woesebacteria bacterium]|nr:hypothetical protein [Candidatus Woesebacteria bacterium]